MNFEALTSFEHVDSALPPPPVATSSQPPSHYFDRTGWLWILACVLFSTTTGQLLPKLFEPDGWHRTLASLGLNVASMPPQDDNPAQPTRAALAEQEPEALNGAGFRQF
jgi:hypothetical protein